MDEILGLYLRLGKKVQRDFLNGEEIDEKYRDLCQEIVEAEKNLYKSLGYQVLAKEEGVCPSCGHSFEEGYNFCTSCGFDIKTFYENLNECELCHSLSSGQDNFCPACGALKDLGLKND